MPAATIDKTGSLSGGTSPMFISGARQVSCGSEKALLHLVTGRDPDSFQPVVSSSQHMSVGRQCSLDFLGYGLVESLFRKGYQQVLFRNNNGEPLSLEAICLHSRAVKLETPSAMCQRHLLTLQSKR